MNKPTHRALDLEIRKIVKFELVVHKQRVQKVVPFIHHIFVKEDVVRRWHSAGDIPALPISE